MASMKTPDLNSTGVQNSIMLLLLIFFIALGVLSVIGKTLTADEDRHYLYGENILQGNSTRFDDSKMPFSALNALPKSVAGLLPEGPLTNILGKFITARIITLLFSALVGFLVFYWSRSMYGFMPGLFSLVLYILDPNIIAHSQLVTTDLYAAGTITFAFYTLWRFARQRDLKNGLICAVALGLSLIAKYTSIVLFPLFCLTIFLYDLPALVQSYRLKTWVTLRTHLLNYLVYGVVASVISITVINFAFLFNRTFTPLGDYKFKSSFFESFQAQSSLLRALPVPTPYPYLQGLDWVMHRERTGNGYPSLYLLGEIHEAQGFKLEGFKGYYFVASLLKVPIATQVILWTALLVFIFHKGRQKQFLQNELFLIVPVIFYAIYFNFFYNAQIGIRYYLVVFPFLYVFAGSLFQNWPNFSSLQKFCSFALVAYLLVSVLSYFPNYLAYFNEIVWDRKTAYKYVADSNINWGQNKNELKEYLSEHPDVIVNPAEVQPGTLVVDVNGLVGIIEDPEKYAWLRNNFEPVDTVAYSYLIYEISPDEVTQLCATTTYCKK